MTSTPNKKSAAKRFHEIAKQITTESTSWADAHNRLFGPGGHFVRLFPTREARTAFAKSPQANAVKKILADLPQSREEADDPRLATANGHITLRVPRSMHAALLAEAEAEKVSLNQLLLTKAAVQLRAVVR